MHIGPYQLDNPLILAPMAGITDQPFRNLCLKYGAGLTVSEMLSSNPDVWQSEKSLHRSLQDGDEGIRSVQIAGSCPELMAQAAQHNVAQGAQIIDINMGCPAKKVNKKLAGSALLQDPVLVKQILDAVVASVDVPVTLKIRTGWDRDNRNGEHIAEIAQQAGIQSLAVHGRTRADMYKGDAEYKTIAAIKRAVDIPVVANGDITSGAKAKEVLEATNADALMIGRGAQGNPWIFQEVAHYLATGKSLSAPSDAEFKRVVLQHIAAIHQFYGEFKGVLMSRKHTSWYLSDQQHKDFRRQFNSLTDPISQLDAVENYL